MRGWFVVADCWMLCRYCHLDCIRDFSSYCTDLVLVICTHTHAANMVNIGARQNLMYAGLLFDVIRTSIHENLILPSDARYRGKNARLCVLMVPQHRHAVPFIKKKDMQYLFTCNETTKHKFKTLFRQHLGYFTKICQVFSN